MRPGSGDDQMDELPADVAELVARGRDQPDGPDPAVRARLRARILAPTLAGLPASGRPSGGGGARTVALGKSIGMALATFALGVGSGVVLHTQRQPPAPVPVAAPLTAAAAPTPQCPPPVAVAPAPSAAPVAPAGVRGNCPAAPARAPGAGAAADRGLGRERALLDQARAALVSGDPQAALGTLERHRRGFPDGRLAEERDVLRVKALFAAGRTTEAREAAASFLRKHPASLFRSAVEDAPQTDSGPAPNDEAGRSRNETRDSLLRRLPDRCLLAAPESRRFDVGPRRDRRLAPVARLLDAFPGRRRRAAAHRRRLGRLHGAIIHDDRLRSGPPGGPLDQRRRPVRNRRVRRPRSPPPPPATSDTCDPIHPTMTVWNPSAPSLQLLEGFEYQVTGLTVSDVRLKFNVPIYLPLADWCACQLPYADTRFCVPDGTIEPQNQSDGGSTCTWVFESTNHHPTVKVTTGCCRLTRCSGFACICNQTTGCAYNAQSVSQFDLSINGTHADGNALHLIRTQ